MIRRRAGTAAGPPGKASLAGYQEAGKGVTVRPARAPATVPGRGRQRRRWRTA